MSFIAEYNGCNDYLKHWNSAWFVQFYSHVINSARHWESTVDLEIYQRTWEIQILWDIHVQMRYITFNGNVFCCYISMNAWLMFAKVWKMFGSGWEIANLFLQSCKVHLVEYCLLVKSSSQLLIHQPNWCFCLQKRTSQMYWKSGFTGLWSWVLLIHLVD